MSLWRQLSRGIRALFRTAAADQEVADEIQHYLDEVTAAHVARGLPIEAARRAARREVGNREAIKEQVRSSGWEHTIETLAADLKYAGRRLRTDAGFTAIVVSTIALGIGATTAVFSAVHPILFEPLPYPDADRIVTIAEIRRDGARLDGTFGMYRGFAEGTRSFDALAVFKPWQPILQERDRPERFDGQRVSTDYFRTLGVTPVLGRNFEPDDDRPGAPAVVILSDALWRRRFLADPAILGQPITLDDRPFTVIGVMADGFENVVAPDAALWAPMQYDMSQGRAWGHHLRTVGRLRSGVSLEHASDDVAAAGRRVLAEQRPVTYGAEMAFALYRLQDDVTRGVRPALLAIFGAAALVLAIACVNVSNLFLARGVRRRSEFALRVALGAGRTRLITQVFIETLVVSALGGAVGIGIAVLGVRALAGLAPPDLPRLDAIRIHGDVFTFALGLTTIVGAICGFIPARQAAGTDPQRDIGSGSHRVAGGGQRTRSALVIAEVALALVLLVSSGLLLRSLERLFAVPSGFKAANVLTMQLPASNSRSGLDERQARWSRVLEEVHRVPGVEAAGLTSQLPMSGDLDEFGVHFEAAPSLPAATWSAFRYAVSPGFMQTMDIPLRRGRLFDERDRSDGARAAVVSESLARTRFGDADPIGRRLRVGPTDGPPYTIVGVVDDVRQVSLALSQSNAVYVPAHQWPFPESVMSLVVRARGDAASLTAAVREAIWSIDKNQPIVRVVLLDDLVAQSAAERRFAVVLFQAFALAALILAAAGIYGVLSGSVAERTREIGVRSALGASRGTIIGLVLRQGLGLAAAGALIGVPGAAAAAHGIASLLFGVSPLDLITYTGAAALLGTVAALACGVPAWRAVRIDPATTLRAE